MSSLSIRLPALEVPATTVATTFRGVLEVPGISIPAREVTVDEVEVVGLLDAARAAAGRAHAPFSRFPVGAVVVMADDPEGRRFAGANVENSSFGGTVCAERTAILSAAAAGFRRIALLAVSTIVTREAALRDRSPCGLCRQVIREFADADTLVLVDNGSAGRLADVFDIERLLPHGFRFPAAGPGPA